MFLISFPKRYDLYMSRHDIGGLLSEADVRATLGKIEPGSHCSTSLKRL